VPSWRQASDNLHACPHLQGCALRSLCQGLHVCLVERCRLPIVEAYLRVFRVHEAGDLALFALVPSWRQAADYLHALPNRQGCWLRSHRTGSREGRRPRSGRSPWRGSLRQSLHVSLVERCCLPVVQTHLGILGINEAGDLALLTLVPSWCQAPNNLDALPDLQGHVLGSLGKSLHISFVEGRRQPIIQAHLGILRVHKARNLAFLALVASWSQTANDLHTLTDLQSRNGCWRLRQGLNVRFVERSDLPCVQLDFGILSSVDEASDLPPLALVAAWRHTADDLDPRSYLQCCLGCCGCKRSWWRKRFRKRPDINLVE